MKTNTYLGSLGLLMSTFPQSAVNIVFDILLYSLVVCSRPENGNRLGPCGGLIPETGRPIPGQLCEGGGSRANNPEEMYVRQRGTCLKRAVESGPCGIRVRVGRPKPHISLTETFHKVTSRQILL